MLLPHFGALDRQPASGTSRQIAGAEGLVWLWGAHECSELLIPNLIAPRQPWAVSQDSNNQFALIPSVRGIAGENTAGTNPQALQYLASTTALSGLKQLSLLIWFRFNSAAVNHQWMSFRTDNQHSLDIFSQTSSSVTWGTDWAGAWNGTSTQALSGLSNGDFVCLGASITQTGARLFHQGTFARTKTGSAFTTSSSTVAICRSGEHGRMGGAAFAVALPDEAMAAYTSNPWQLYGKRRIWVPVSAGGGSVSLIVADATHAHTADGLVLTSSTALSVADATHAHAADAITLVVGSVLAIAEASHAHAADSPTLTAASALAVADATHSHAADNITLSVAGATNLTVADALHGHAADALALTSAHALIVADATHGHTVDGLTLTAASVLAIQEALHAHAADNITLDASGAVNLLLADGLHAHTADGVALTVAAWLTVADALHGHAADNVVLTFGGAVVEPLARYTIAAKARRLTITAAARRLEIRK